MRKLYTEHVLILYALVAKATSGRNRGLRDVDILESVVKVQDVERGNPKDKNILYKTAARLMKKIIDERPFVDGNKRTAMLAGLTLIKINGYELKLRIGDVEDYALCVANEHPSEREVAAWLKKRSRAIK